MSQNPFETSHIQGDFAETVERADGEVLADRGNRLVASIVDSILVMCITLPIQLATGQLQLAAAQKAQPVMLELFVNLAGIAALLLVHGWMLTSRGQSIGKRMLGIQVVDYRDNGLLPFARVILIRSLWLTPLGLISTFLPLQGKAIFGMVIALLSITDSLLIFGEARRCFHDTLAGSIVVKYRPNRARSAF